MSLKARIEAVIYAAEEPVTLAQLAPLFRDEALASRAARTAASVDPEAPTEDDVAGEPELVDEAPSATPEGTESLKSTPQAEGAASTDSQSETQSADRDGPADAEKKAARQREREVRDEIRSVIDELIADYNAADSGLEIREVAGGFRVGTRPEYHDAVRAFIKTLRAPFRLSMQALETLAVIAYKQPITAPEIGEIRGVDSSGVLGSLVARKLITTAGRKQVVGRPILYKTTKEFLVRFGLKDVNELPSLEEFEKMASELAETEAEGPIAPGEEELPFAQNEMAEIEEASALESEGGSASAQDAAPTEHDVAEHAEKAHS